MAYNLHLTPSDIEAIHFIGGRYSWSTALLGFEPGNLLLAESEAWNLRDAFEEDTQGGHSYFPMLHSSSDLYAKLITFMDSVV